MPCQIPIVIKKFFCLYNFISQVSFKLTATVEPFLPTPPVKITEKMENKFATAQITVITPIKYLN